jgi:2,3,4,5-tetrahydropyridine-2,6-dicarboxylate N-succinyltransferase
MNIAAIQSFVEHTWEDRSDLQTPEAGDMLNALLQALEDGSTRAAQPLSNGEWQVNEWVKKGILLYFGHAKNREISAGDLSFYDKVPTRNDLALTGARFVPPGLVRRGTYIGKSAIIMPSYVNIGAYVGQGTMVDTWATVGSCAQIGADVHLSGGVGVGGVLEPLQAAPVIIEDGAFIGSRCIIVEGVRVGREAVLGANVVLTASTKIIDVTGDAPVESRGYIPPRAVVIPGTTSRTFSAGTYQVPCALIIGQRQASTDLKTSLNAALREYDVSL